MEKGSLDIFRSVAINSKYNPEEGYENFKTWPLSRRTMKQVSAGTNKVKSYSQVDVFAKPFVWWRWMMMTFRLRPLKLNKNLLESYPQEHFISTYTDPIELSHFKYPIHTSRLSLFFDW